MIVRTRELWSLVWSQPEIDPDDLAHAVEDRAASGDMDYRTRLLIRDSVEALAAYWGPGRLQKWLSASPAQKSIAAIRAEEFERPGFPMLKECLMEKTEPEQILEFFRDLGSKVNVRKRLRLAVGGSVALIMPGFLVRSTSDIDVVNEVPAEIRSQQALMDELSKRYRLILAHFQSHYLPSGWDQRLHYLDTFDDLQVYLVDVYDVCLSKMFSARTKDLDDLRALKPQLDKDTLTRRLKDTTGAMLAAEELRKRAAHNWYILYGEPLPQ